MIRRRFVKPTSRLETTKRKPIGKENYLVKIFIFFGKPNKKYLKKKGRLQIRGQQDRRGRHRRRV